MKSELEGYYHLDDKELSSLWDDGTIVLDTNVLLNLYRYPANARDQLLRVFAKYKARLWIPYQIAIEFQENRLGVIAEQVGRFAEVRSIVEKAGRSLKGQIDGLQLAKRHSLINPEPLLSKTEEVFESFLTELDSLRGEQPDVFHDDPIRLELDRILDGCVGSPFSTQAELDDIYDDGDKRYADRRPPGYMDQDKFGDDVPSYLYGGLVYKREFGDLLLWKQLIAEAQHRSWSKILFVTDDLKEDWWWLAKSHGNKTIGARPELVEELMRESDVQLFKMYTSEQFLEYAKEHQGADVSDESIEHVREISRLAPPSGTLGILGTQVEDAFMKWLELEHADDDLILHAGFPDVVAVDAGDGTGTGYELRVARSWGGLRHRYRETLIQADSAIQSQDVQSCYIVLVSQSESIVDRLCDYIAKTRDNIPPGVGVRVALLDRDERGGCQLNWRLGIRPDENE